ncbi:Golgin subfamily A member 4 [Lamellibrachia satsuma]|nr:Golgin subfamily A member 4 [Lamellibrachia satsuma]
MNLQAQVIQQSGENAKLKIQERELRHKIAELETLTAGDSLASPLHADTTEMEYLRNIIFEYMMGKETKTLCKVITTVLKFSDEQSRKILEKEEMKVSVWLRDVS